MNEEKEVLAARCKSLPAGDRLLLGTKGFSVELLRHSGTDLDVANAARVSFDRSSASLSERDIGLINYLAKHKHWTPFGCTLLCYRITMPVYVARQLMRSNVGVVWNEVSRRYVDTPPSIHIPFYLRSRPPKSMKQGSSGEPVENSLIWAEAMAYNASSTLTLYDNLIAHGVAPEVARGVLPVSHFTSVMATMNIATAARIIDLRADSHAQMEIQHIAHLMMTNIPSTLQHSMMALFPSFELSSEYQNWLSKESPIET